MFYFSLINFIFNPKTRGVFKSWSLILKLHTKAQMKRDIQKLQLPPVFCFLLNHLHEIVTVISVKETRWKYIYKAITIQFLQPENCHFHTSNTKFTANLRIKLQIQGWRVFPLLSHFLYVLLCKSMDIPSSTTLNKEK